MFSIVNFGPAEKLFNKLASNKVLIFLSFWLCTTATAATISLKSERGFGIKFVVVVLAVFQC